MNTSAPLTRKAYRVKNHKKSPKFPSIPSHSINMAGRALADRNIQKYTVEHRKRLSKYRIQGRIRLPFYQTHKETYAVVEIEFNTRKQRVTHVFSCTIN